MRNVKQIDSRGILCPHCAGTHLHTQNTDGSWKCMRCKKSHDGISYRAIQDKIQKIAKGNQG